MGGVNSGMEMDVDRGTADTAAVRPPVLAPAVPDAAAHFAAIVESSYDAIISKNLEGIVTSWNRGAERIFGYTAGEMVGRSILQIIPPERQGEEPGILDRIRRGERVEHFETVRQRSDGTRIHISLTISPIRNAHGEIIGASKIARDISDRKRAEDARELLLNEIKHRVKNTLGTVQAIASQTFRSASREDRAAFTARLHALADAHDLLTQENWESVDVRDVVSRAFAPFDRAGGHRANYTGPSVRLSPANGLQLSLILHELATNAAKYGAFSVKGGMVAVDWTREGPDLRLVWRERGGPAVAPPVKKGFGTQMIERTLRGDQGSARFDFDPSGLVESIATRL